MSELGRLVDPRRLDEASGPRGAFGIDVEPALAGATVLVTLPRRIPCADCAGGGCSRCGNSGAFALPSEPSQRSVRLKLPADLGEPVRVRVQHPCGSRHEIEQLIVTLRPAERTSQEVNLVDYPRRSQEPSPRGPHGGSAFSPHAALLSLVLVSVLSAVAVASILAR